MESRRRRVDRREQARFEVVGDLWGTLDIVHPLPLVNIGAGGALVEADRPWPVGSIHSVVVANGVALGEAKVRVCHVAACDGEGGVRYLVGVEFLDLSPVLVEQIARWLGAAGGQVSE